MTAEPAAPAILRMTESDFLAHHADERPSYEFVNGEVLQKPMTKRTHVALAGEIAALLREYRRRSRGAFSGEDPTINLSRAVDRRYRAPDVAFWAADKAQGEEILLPPTLAVEIQSQGQTRALLRAKCREYRERGVDVAWLVLPVRRTIEVFDATPDGTAFGAGTTLAPAELPGFELPVSELFAVLD
jgi:Uma2 family endonuclease